MTWKDALNSTPYKLYFALNVIALIGFIVILPVFFNNVIQPKPGIQLNGDLRTARESMMRDFERKYLEGLLADSGGNVSAAARAAGVDRKYFYRLLWRAGLR